MSEWRDTNDKDRPKTCKKIEKVLLVNLGENNFWTGWAFLLSLLEWGHGVYLNHNTSVVVMLVIALTREWRRITECRSSCDKKNTEHKNELTGWPTHLYKHVKVGSKNTSKFCKTPQLFKNNAEENNFYFTLNIMASVYLVNASSCDFFSSESASRRQPIWNTDMEWPIFVLHLWMILQDESFLCFSFSLVFVQA